MFTRWFLLSALLWSLLPSRTSPGLPQFRLYCANEHVFRTANEYTRISVSGSWTFGHFADTHPLSTHWSIAQLRLPIDPCRPEEHCGKQFTKTFEQRLRDCIPEIEPLSRPFCNQRPIIAAGLQSAEWRPGPKRGELRLVTANRMADKLSHGPQPHPNRRTDSIPYICKQANDCFLFLNVF